MKQFVEDSKPIYQQIAEGIEDEILRKVLAEEEQVPSTNQFARHYQINPATAAKGINLLVDEGILYKKRGIGMFVAEGALKSIQKKRQKLFFQEYVVPLLEEAKKLNLDRKSIIKMIKDEMKEAGEDE